MSIRWPSARAALALLLLALVAAPLAKQAFAAADPHACCPERAPRADAPNPCQQVAAMDCCAQLGVPSTSVGDGLIRTPTGFALIVATPALPPAPVLLLAYALHAHGPPQGAQLRATVLRL